MKIKTRVTAIISLFALMLMALALPVMAAEAEATAEKSFWTTPSQIIPLAAFIAILIVLAIVFFVLPKRREKSFKFFRGLKSECKKISWYSWKQTWKGTLVVAVTAVVLATVIGLLDVAFTGGITAISKLF